MLLAFVLALLSPQDRSCLEAAPEAACRYSKEAATGICNIAAVLHCRADVSSDRWSLHHCCCRCCAARCVENHRLVCSAYYGVSSHGGERIAVG